MLLSLPIPDILGPSTYVTFVLIGVILFEDQAHIITKGLPKLLSLDQKVIPYPEVTSITGDHAAPLAPKEGI